jgi:hypothetical protein
MIGVIGTIDEGDEMVYMLHCDYWNKGYMSEALATLAGREGVFWKLPSRQIPASSKHAINDSFRSCKCRNIGGSN